MQRNFIQKQTPTTVNTKKFYTKSKIVKQENFFNFLQLLFENCLKKLEKVFIETIEDFPDVWKQSV